MVASISARPLVTFGNFTHVGKLLRSAITSAILTTTVFVWFIFSSRSIHQMLLSWNLMIFRSSFVLLPNLERLQGSQNAGLEAEF
jgi:hypothetical protein